MFVIYVKSFEKFSLRCYIGDPINENWLNICEIDQALKFNTEAEANQFIKDNKLSDVGVKAI